MANNSTISHRFANKDYNESKGLKGSSVHIEGKNYYSYSTVFGQWVDEKVCLVYWGSTSSTSNKHKLYPSDFPKDIVIFPYDDGGSSYYGNWHGCNLLGYKGEFNFDKRAQLIDYYVGEIFTSLAAIAGGKKKGLDGQAQRSIEENWGYIVKLCSLYRDTTINKWLKKKRIDLDGIWSKKKKLVRELDAQHMEVSHLVDVLFGAGTFKSYWDYCARYRKSENKREQMAQLCSRLGIANPYERWQGEKVLHHDMTADDIRRLTAKERIDIHFAALMHKEQKENETKRKEKYNRNSDNAYKWITGYEPHLHSCYSHTYEWVGECRNMFTGQEYNLPKTHIFGFYWLNKSVSFNYDGFRKSEDKEQWIADFYAECKQVEDDTTAIRILRQIDAHKAQKMRVYDDDRYIDDEFLRENTTDEEYVLAKAFIAKQDKYFADQEARRRAEDIARLQRQEEERKERELQAQIKQEQINACIERGIEGFRDLWRLHYTDIHRAESEAANTKVFYYGGNVLMRFSMNKDKVETSKHIRVTIPTCLAIWKVVSKWHENPESFKPITIKTLDGTYTVSSYKNDILTAGCHDIAYSEMQHMYNKIMESV